MHARRQAQNRENEQLFHEFSKYLEGQPRYQHGRAGLSLEELTNDAFVVLLETKKTRLPADTKKRERIFQRVVWRVEARHRRRNRREQKVKDQAAQEVEHQQGQDLTQADLRTISKRAAIKLAKKPYRYRQALLLLVSGKVDKKDNKTLAIYLKCSVRRAGKIKAIVMKVLTTCATEFDSKVEGEK